MYGSVAIEMVFKGKDCFLKGVPVKVISDVEVTNLHPFSIVPMRRCGLQFKEMTPFRISQVEKFIENYSL